MLHSVKQYIESNNLLQKSDKVIVGLSGGSDSVVLLSVLIKLGYECIAAHANFHLRAAESDRDQKFVEDLCQSLSVKLYVKHFDTTAYSRQQHVSIEMAARELRYSWFEELRLQTASEKIAVAHHLNDQAETVILNLRRGTGVRGLAAMKPQNGNIIRPLLTISKDTILQYATANNLSYVIDSTNTDTHYKRNLIRKELLGYQSKEIEHIAQTAEYMYQVQMLIDHYISQFHFDKNKIHIPTLLSLPYAEIVLHELISDYGFNQTKQILKALNSKSGKLFSSNTHIAYTNRDYLIIEPKTADKNTDKTPIIRVQTEEYTALCSFPKEDAWECYLDIKALDKPLILRHWKQGDYFYPLGMNKNKKKIQDFFTDKHVSIKEKQKVWLLCCGEDIAWVVGYRIDERYKVKHGSNKLVHIELSLAE